MAHRDVWATLASAPTASRHDARWRGRRDSDLTALHTRERPRASLIPRMASAHSLADSLRAQESKGKYEQLAD